MGVTGGHLEKEILFLAHCFICFGGPFVICDPFVTSHGLDVSWTLVCNESSRFLMLGV